MRAFKFTTKILPDGTIHIPIDKSLYKKEVEITILPKQSKRQSAKRDTKAVDFVKKWAGFLNEPRPDALSGLTD